MRMMRFDDEGFEAFFRVLVERGEEPPAGVEETVAQIIADVRRRGDDALCELTRKFDRLDLSTTPMEVGAEEIDQALAAVDAESLDVLRLANDRIAAFHAKQKEQTWLSFDEE
ncbi:MAG: histidinol dehydrogenase, partial [Desulfuromonadales bacterium]|nr:histidinol dehydrogenase [Desulfuromonadales bacterium]NIR34208.1 histidinol dehydrogenase [Desulfuromonadales bacterium]NIS41656.1 histidinol dehydrogenase [Desulfuromonadales bacterium]